MLIKELCRKCRLIYIENTVGKEDACFNKDKSFDSRWNFGVLACPKANIEDNQLSYNIKNNPPKECSFLIEQLLENEKGIT